MVSILGLLSGSCKKDKYDVKDIDGNVYKTIIIGTQTWMAENLKTTKYNDGTAIPLVTDGVAWTALTTPGYCWYNNDAGSYKDIYGALYNWYTVNTRKLCPIGWHVPSDAEWTTLTNYMGDNVVGGKLKETGTIHWQSPNKGATNESGFTALPGAFFSSLGIFFDLGIEGGWHSSTENYHVLPDNRGAGYQLDTWLVYSDGVNIVPVVPGKKEGFSVRCVKD
jgi:uncharacterized protein (TIGR02145 family)